MSIFKDFMDDLEQSEKEPFPKDDFNKMDTEEEIVNTLDTEENSPEREMETEKMKEWLEEFTQEEDQEEMMPEETSQPAYDTETEKIIMEEEEKEEEEEELDDNVDLELLEALHADQKPLQEEKTVPKLRTASVSRENEVTVIAKGTIINGSISAEGAVDIVGEVTGDVDCLGRLNVSGKLKGNVSAAEICISTEKMEGNLISEGSVKISLGTVVVGDVTATSGVIAGAVKGEIDINGPVMIDSTAIIKGNIKAKSIQINNGAVIEGFCSLSYSDVDVDNIFE